MGNLQNPHLEGPLENQHQTEFEQLHLRWPRPSRKEAPQLSLPIRHQSHSWVLSLSYYATSAVFSSSRIVGSFCPKRRIAATRPPLSKNSPYSKSFGVMLRFTPMV